jgi:hypothetical protein
MVHSGQYLSYFANFLLWMLIAIAFPIILCKMLFNPESEAN